jgi:hypothetical protein
MHFLTSSTDLSVVMPGFMPGIHVFTLPFCIKVVDGRDKPGHDNR